MALFDNLLNVPDTDSLQREMDHLAPNEREGSDPLYHALRDGDRWQFIGSRLIDFIGSLNMTNKLLILLVAVQLPHLASDIAYLKALVE